MRVLGCVHRDAGTVKPGGRSAVETSSGVSVRPIVVVMFLLPARLVVVVDEAGVGTHTLDLCPVVDPGARHAEGLLVDASGLFGDGHPGSPPAATVGAGPDISQANEFDVIHS